MDALTIGLYIVFTWFMISGFLLFWCKSDVINKIKLFLNARKGAKLFRLHKKDGTVEEFVDYCEQGGAVKHDGDTYLVNHNNIAMNRSKNCPEVTIVEGELQSIDLFDRTEGRVDTKQLRALFSVEREKSRADIEALLSTLKINNLKIIIILLFVLLGIILVIAWLTFQHAEAMHSLLPAVQKTTETVIL